MFKRIHTTHFSIVISHDDIEVIGFPRMTARTIKGMTKTKFNLVPWLMINHGTSDLDYVYLPKNRWKKGANRMITQLMAAVRRIKSDYSKPGHRARRLVFIADNCSENKNNTLLAWCHSLVENGWFDSIELLFGTVGHTHNGVDA